MKETSPLISASDNFPDTPSKGFRMVCLKEQERLMPQNPLLNRFVYVLKGEIVLYSAFKSPLYIPGRHFFFATSGAEMYLEALQDTDLLVMNILNIQDFYPEIKQSCQEHDVPCTDSFPHEDYFLATDLLAHFFETLAMYHSSDMPSIRMQNIKEKELFLLLAQSYTHEQVANIFFRFFGDMADFKTRAINYAGHITTVQELAGLMGMERGHFHKVFKKHFGVSPYQWMLQQKAIQTLEYINKKHLPLKAIADHLGFSSQSHLNKFCKKKFGKTAKALRSDI